MPAAAASQPCHSGGREGGAPARRLGGGSILLALGALLLLLGRGPVSVRLLHVLQHLQQRQVDCAVSCGRGQPRIGGWPRLASLPPPAVAGEWRGCAAIACGAAAPLGGSARCCGSLPHRVKDRAATFSSDSTMFWAPRRTWGSPSWSSLRLFSSMRRWRSSSYSVSVMAPQFPFRFSTPSARRQGRRAAPNDPLKQQGQRGRGVRPAAFESEKKRRSPAGRPAAPPRVRLCPVPEAH